MLDLAILDGARTPFAKAFGPLADVPAQELGRAAVAEALRRSSLAPGAVDQVVIGNVATPADAANIARVIALQAGVPRDRVAHTVGRNCASGLEAIAQAANLIRLGEAGVVVAGGAESMSRIPLLYNDEATRLYLGLGRARSVWGRLGTMLRFRPRHFQPVIGVQLGLTDPVSGLIMGETAELLAGDYDITREEQDRYALRSHQLAGAAQKDGRLAQEIVAVAGVTQDVGLRHDQTPEALAKLRPYFKEGGTVTVGNSSMITDGAAAVVVMSGERARAEGRPVLGYLRGYAAAGCDPARMGLGPVFATRRLFDKMGLTMADIDLVELNEAFAAVVLACGRELGLDESRVNVNGGAIALGHPVGASGARLVLTLLKELRRRGLRRGLATLCVGGGQGMAAVVESGEEKS